MTAMPRVIADVLEARRRAVAQAILKGMGTGSWDVGAVADRPGRRGRRPDRPNTVPEPLRV